MDSYRFFRVWMASGQLFAERFRGRDLHRTGPHASMRALRASVDDHWDSLVIEGWSS